MAHMRWTREGGWSDRGVIPYGPLELTPGASVFHYCQSVFEGIKAYSERTAPCGPSAPATMPRA